MVVVGWLYQSDTTLKLPVHMYVPGSSVINWKLIIIKLACSYDNQRISLMGRIGVLFDPFVEN